MGSRHATCEALRSAPHAHTTTKEKIDLDSVISALAVLVDDNASIDGTLAVRAAALDAALDAAITHVAGDGCKNADGDGTGAMVVGVARTFERYLTASDDTDTIANEGDELLANITDALRQAYRLLRSGQADAIGHTVAADVWANDRDELATGIDTLLDRIGVESADDREARRRAAGVR
jgi:hypothetical protein